MWWHKHHQHQHNLKNDCITAECKLKAVLLSSGLSALSGNIIREYHYIETLKTWAEAQNYCREAFTDLATVTSQDDNDKLLSILQVRGQVAWIGLYDDLTRWKWTMGNKDFDSDTNYSNWNTNEPNQLAVFRTCIQMSQGGFWNDNRCSRNHPAVCYNGKRQTSAWSLTQRAVPQPNVFVCLLSEKGPSRYIVVREEMNWTDARKYCKSNYTDLATVKNSSENELISSLLSTNSWIGLYRRTWNYWSDKSCVTFNNWHHTQPDNNERKELCAAVCTSAGKWWNYKCQEKHSFICQKVKVPNRKVLRLKFRSEADMNDPAVKQQVLEQVLQTSLCNELWVHAMTGSTGSFKCYMVEDVLKTVLTITQIAEQRCYNVFVMYDPGLSHFSNNVDKELYGSLKSHNSHSSFCIYSFFFLTAPCKTGDKWIIRLQTPLGRERRASFSEGKEKDKSGRYFLLESEIHARLLVVCFQWFTLAHIQ